MADRRRVLCLQTAPRFGEADANRAAVAARLEGLRADLVVLPELAASGYAFRDRAEALAHAEDGEDGPTPALAARLSREVGGVVVVGFAERAGARLYNAAVVAAGGQVRAVYRKAHLFGFEKEIYDAGDAPPCVVEHAGLRVGVMICFDWVFPEAARLLALQGADVIAHPSNLVLPLCQQAMPVRALENRLFTVTANRVGREHRPPRALLAFTGRSLVCGPDGEVVAEADATEEALLAVTLDIARSREKVLASGNDPFRERRPELYTSLANATQDPHP